MTRCCTIFCWAGWTKRLTSKSSCTTTGSGIADWRGSCGAGGPRRRPTGAISITPCSRRIVERSRAVVVHNPAAARVVRGACAARARGRNPASFRAAARASRRRRSRPLAATLGDGPDRHGVRRLRVPAGIEAAAGRTGSIRRGASRPSADGAAGGRRVRLDGPGARRRAPAVRAREWCEGRTSTSANSGWRRARWMPASICVIRRRGRLRGLPFA